MIESRTLRAKQYCTAALSGALFAAMCTTALAEHALDAHAIGKAADAKATTTDDGVVRLNWSRDDVKVTIDGMEFPPAAGLGSWAAFTATAHGAMVMGDTVVFQDEVDAAMDAAFAHGLEVSALHNHFFFDEPKVYFMHIGGHGDPLELTKGVKAVWNAIKEVRKENPQPATRFGGLVPQPGAIDAQKIGKIIGHKASTNPGGVVKVTIGRDAEMHGTKVGGSMGLTTWATFSGGDDLAAIDGDFAMTAEEVQPVLRAMRRAGFHVVALHNHMIGGEPFFYFTHFWATGPAAKLAKGFKSVLDVQAGLQTGGDTVSWTFDDVPLGQLPEGWKSAATHAKGEPNPWSVAQAAGAPSGDRVLALPATPMFEKRTFNLCWTDRVEFQDGTVEVKVKAGGGEVDRGGGPIWRVRDHRNYYIARWNPLEKNFRLYAVVDGEREELARAKADLPDDRWHTITIHHFGGHIECSLDGSKLLEVDDARIREPGGVGVWTKADAASMFDDFIVTRAVKE